MSEGSDAETRWRQMLSENWQEIRKNTDWKGIPQVHDYVHRLMTGRPAYLGGDWIAHTRDKHLVPLSQSLGRPLTMISFGVGLGNIEAAILETGRWPLGKLVCCEYDQALVAQTAAALARFPVETAFCQFDFNKPGGLPDAQYDIAFFCHALHHCEDIEGFMAFLNGLLPEHGLIVGLDYFGPPRLQVEHETNLLLQEIFSALPERLRLNLVTGDIDQRCATQTVALVRGHDPTEAPRSSDLRSLLFSIFPVVEKLPMGGTLLRHLLAHRAGNYRSDDDFAILSLLMLIEREMIQTRRIASDDLYFVLRRSDRI